MDWTPLRLMSVNVFPNPVMWMWVSMRPGTTVLPFRSSTLVLFLISAWISLFVPTSIILVFLMATA